MCDLIHEEADIETWLYTVGNHQIKAIRTWYVISMLVLEMSLL